MTTVAALLHLPKSRPSNSCLLSLFSTSEANMKFTVSLPCVILMLDSLSVEAKGSPGGFLGSKGSKSKSKTGIRGEVECDADAPPRMLYLEVATPTDSIPAVETRALKFVSMPSSASLLWQTPMEFGAMEMALTQ